MKTTSSLTFAALLGAWVVTADRVSQGCFSSTTGLTLNGTLDFNSRGSCGDACYALGDSVFGMQNKLCVCGNNLPPASTKESSTSCIYTCPGYPSDTCGGASVWSIYLTGLTNSATNAEAASSDISSASKASATASSASTSKPAAVTTVVGGGATVIVTATPTATSSNSSGSSGPSKTGIAIGVVVGILAIASIAGGIFLFVRNRKRREVEEEYRRNAAVSSFIAGGKPGSSAGNSFPDTRLEPAIMANRRMSDGSIMDNQDYSRRILKVTNA